jgi:nucleoside-diphosphate-sugar epimerase
MSIDSILVTGAAGFLGSVLVRQAVNAGLSVTATDRAVITKFSGVDLISADILDPLSLLKVFEAVDCVCHVAGLAHIFNKSEAMSAPFHAVNVVGSKNVVGAAVRAGVKHFVFISSVSVYGGVAHGKDEDSECRPEGPYAESKLQAERYLIELCQKEGVNLTILRLATLYGEGDPGNVARLIGSIKRGRFIWVGKGKNFKSLIHREDAARACIAVIKAPVSGINIYNVSAPPCQMRDIVAAITLCLGKSVPSWHVPASFALNSAKIIKNISFNYSRLSSIQGTLQKWLADDYYNTDKFCKAFNYQTKLSLEEGIKREVGWYLDSHLHRSCK